MVVLAFRSFQHPGRVKWEAKENNSKNSLSGHSWVQRFSPNVPIFFYPPEPSDSCFVHFNPGLFIVANKKQAIGCTYLILSGPRGPKLLICFFLSEYQISALSYMVLSGHGLASKLTFLLLFSLNRVSKERYLNSIIPIS